MVGLASGLVLGPLGYTHCCIEDIGVLRNIPGLNIISPADSLETVKALNETIKSKKPTYIRLTGSSNNPMVYKKDYDFKIGKSITVHEGKNITIFSSGAMVYQCIEVAKLLEKHNLSCKVINMHTIKPLDTDSVKLACEESSLIVSVEEHNVIGGLGSAIAEFKAFLSNTPKMLILGIKDSYSKGGSYDFLKKKHRLVPPLIVEDVLKNFKNK
jgi:transketolase